MLRVFWLLPLVLIAPVPVSTAEPPPAGYHRVALNGHTFTLPIGFTIEIAAKSPQVERPISVAFDEKGRLYVCDSSGSNEKVAVQLEKKPHRIRRLEDTNGDGVFDKSTVYVPNVMFPEGAMWLNGSLYVAAPPHILKFTDTNDDGTADKTEIWFDGKTLTGCANDLHGPYLGPDGWIYWCKGAFAQQEYTLDLSPLSPAGRGAGGEGKRKFVTRASHIFRARPDGSGLEPVMTGGMDNPVGLAFTPGGERIVSCTFLQHPAGGKRDGLLHAVYGGVYGKDHAPVYEHPWTSPHLMPVMTHLGPAAPCGLRRYESDQFGREYTDNLFCCQFNMRKVSRHVLVPSGSTFTTKDSDFVVSDNVDFHPTDVIEDADGSLLIVDTGGWYKLCCPTSQLVKPDVKGAIYRVKKVGTHKSRTKPQQPPLPGLYAVALNRDTAKVGEAAAGLRDANPFTRRLAAEALGRIGDPKAVPALLGALADEANDRVLDHTLTYALIEIAAPKETAAGLKHASPRARRAVLAALDAMPGGNLDPQAVLDELDAKDAALRETAWWIAGKHPEWGGRLAGYFRDQLKQVKKLTPPQRDELADRLVKFSKNEAIQTVLGETLTEQAPVQRFVLRVMARSGLKALPKPWKAGLGNAIGAQDASVVADGFTALRALPLTEPDFVDVLAVAKLQQAAHGRKWTDNEMLALLAAAPPGTASPTAADFALALRHLNPDAAGTDRAIAADALVRGRLTPEQLVALAGTLRRVSPLDVAKLFPAFTRSKEESVGRALVAALSEPGLRAAIRAEQVKPILDKYPKPVRDAAEKLYAQLAEARKDETAKLERLLQELPSGDVRRGQAVFNGTKAQCAACHKIGYVGGLVGPDLTRIGGIRTERDLLESIVFPSASFVRSYEPVRVATLDGRVLTGIVKADTPEEIVLTVAADKEERIKREDVETIAPGTVSVMPAGLDQQLSRQELADVVAFLRACK